MVDIGRKIDPAGHFRSVLGVYPTGVCVITTIDEDGEKCGMVVGSFTSVSLDPPLVAFLPDKKSRSWQRISESSQFCVNILAKDQLDICARFASSVEDKFAGISHRLSDAGMPILDDVVAWIDCHKDKVVDAGDHYIVIGRAHSLETLRSIEPLLFLKGGYGHFSPLETASCQT